MQEGLKSEGNRCLLIAMPQLMDPNFHQSTTLLAEYTAEGAMGVVLNRPLGMNLNQILAKELESESAERIPVYWGGPVQPNRGWIIHEDDLLAEESVRVADHLYLSCSAKVLRRFLETPPADDGPRFRFFLGYAGWGPGQLETEISASSWVMAPLDRDLIFSENSDTLWRRSIENIGVDPMHLTATPSTEMQ